MKEFVEYIVKQLVDQPEKVSLIEVEGESIVVLELKVASGELGKVIGKSGRIAQAIRTLLAAKSGKLKKKVVLEILDN